ncbi:Nuclear SAM-dependent mono-and asymmetric methyltransferase [Brettanomyces nanus]|uniref:type I protein arginine methyltransferase n=1 Tax=Eeniella nana TaxID=13502 RepID=A0A875S4N1_EENNA|nr:Nuclear SAM-dependent mono-and asymmetric methyltransferase [Brettanomyces nanus]QPG75022.1 Nuclear SAM-dependent mono-and asymmetric methyltransferase [Brettanomyces nanus]
MTEASKDPNSLSYWEQHYFSSYDHFGIHEEMLKDRIRTLSYRNAIMKNKSLFKDKIVLDVGCGTGVLSMFAAQAGAKHVYGVDMSSIIEMARKIIDLNGFSDKITLIKGKLEDLELPCGKVDIIISEWMGYFLLYESMLDTVLDARDRFLKPNGLIFPDKASIHVAMIEDSEYKDEKIHFWENKNRLYGFDYSPFVEIAMEEPLVDTVEGKSVVTNHFKLIEFDLNTVKKEDLIFKRNFHLRATSDDMAHALLAWFDIIFPADKPQNVVRFSTGPQAHYTHWKQTVFYLDDVLELNKGEVIDGWLSCKPNKINNRDLDIHVGWDFKASGALNDVRAAKNSRIYYLR